MDIETTRELNNGVEIPVFGLGVEQVDLYLMHWPVPETRIESWRAMEEIYESGAARAIGVSNFARHHLEDLEDTSDVVPAVNQFELHPFGQQQDVVEATRERGIAVQA